MTRKRLVILSTHPIQYHSPWFRSLAQHDEVDLDVWFCHQATPQDQAAAGFGVQFNWDVSLLDGYSSRFLKNVAPVATVNSYEGLDTPEVKSLIPGERPDAVIVNGWHYKSAWQAIRTCWQYQIPVMARSDSNLHTKRNPAKRALKWPYYRWFIPRLDACLAVGTWSRDYFIHYGASEEQIFLVPHVIDSERFYEQANQLRSEPKSLREKLAVPPDSTLFLFAGKFIHKKRPLDFINAIAQAAQVNPRIAALMIGDGPLRAECEQNVRSKKLPVTFAGFLNQSEIVRAYVAADALVVTSDAGETWGLVVNEALACGLPCFVSDQVGAGPDLIVRYDAGAQYPTGDCGRLAELLVEFAANDSNRNKMKKAANTAAKSFSVDKAVSGTIQALNFVSSKKREHAEAVA